MYPCAIGPPKGLSALARSTSTWIHWWSPVASAKRFTASWVTSYQSLVPSSWPTRPGSSAMVVVVVMPRYCQPGRSGRSAVEDVVGEADLRAGDAGGERREHLGPLGGVVVRRLPRGEGGLGAVVRDGPGGGLPPPGGGGEQQPEAVTPAHRGPRPGTRRG